LPVANFTSNTPVCFNSPIQFTDASTPGGGTINTWSWNFGDASTSALQSPSRTYLTSGVFSVKLKVTTADGCRDSTTKSVTVLPLLTAPVVTAGTATTTTVTFSWLAVPNASGYEVSVNGGAFITPSSGATGLTHTVSGLQPDVPVTIVVRALGTIACQSATGQGASRTLLPDVGVFIPNTFTPNGDGKNDLLKAYGNYMKSINMQIYNQWGEKIFTTTDLQNGWNGSVNGKPQPVGVYVYVVTVTMQDGRVINKKGSVNIVR